MSIDNRSSVMSYDNAIKRTFTYHAGRSNVRMYNGVLADITSDTTDGILLDVDMNYDMLKGDIRIPHPDGVSDPFVDTKHSAVLARDRLTHGIEYTQGITGKEFTYTQNSIIVDALRQLQDAGFLTLNMGGCIDNHTKCFIHFSVGDEYSINGDPHMRGGLVRWAHDGTASLSVRSGATRLFCLNQVPSFSNSWFTIRHTKSAEVKLNDLQYAIVESMAALDKYDKVMGELMDVKITDDEFVRYLERLVPIDPLLTDKPYDMLTQGQKRSLTMAQNRRAAVSDVYFNSPTQENLYGTAAGAFHAAVEASDHRFTGNRGQRMLTGADAGFKDHALQYALTF